jgi:peroxiredoxin
MRCFHTSALCQVGVPMQRMILVVPLLLMASAFKVAQAEESSKAPLIPQNLLRLLHAPEVQAELGFTANDEKLMTVLRDIDGPWWRSRNLPEEKQQAIIRDLEKQLLDALKSLLPEEKIKRLREIEVQSQGTRALGRAGIAKAIGLDNKQHQEIQRAFLETDGLARKLVEKKGSDPTLEKELASARETEQKKLNELLTNPQRMSLGKLIGQPFDTMKLKRIFPLAPELIDSSEWTGAAPTTLASQRGKVVLLHFYAFQCHNCVANFNHYNRWHETLASKGVSVIGIQTPETSAERDAAQVKKAAKDKGFHFPVLIDLKSKNWDAWGNTMWPTVYVVDKNGYIRSWWQGELNWQGATGDKSIETLVDELLAE